MKFELFVFVKILVSKFEEDFDISQLFIDEEVLIKKNYWSYFSAPKFTRYIFKFNFKEFLDKNSDLVHTNKEQGWILS